MVVGVDVDLAGGHEDEGRVDVDGELDVAVFVPVDLKFSLLLVVVECFVVFLLLVLHLLLYYLVDLAQPLHPGQDLGLRQFERAAAGDSELVDVVEDALIVHLALDVARVLFGQRFVFLLDLLDQNLQILGLHEHNRAPHKFKDVYVFDELGSHLEVDLERTRSLHLVLQFLVRSYLLTVPAQPRHHLLHLRRSLTELFDLRLHLVFEFAPVGLPVLTDGHPELADQVEEDSFFTVAPTLFVFLALGLIIEIYLSLVLLDFNDGVDQFFQSSRQIVSHWEVLVGLGVVQFFETVLHSVSNRNVVSISVFIYAQQEIDIVLLAPPDSRPLSEEQTQGDEVQESVPADLPPVGLAHVLQRIFSVFVNQVPYSVQQLKSFRVLNRPLGEHYVLIPLLQSRLIFDILRLVLFNEFLEEELQIGFVLRKRKAECPEEAVSICFDLGQSLAFKFAANAHRRALNLFPPPISVLKQQLFQLFVVVCRPFASIRRGPV